MLVAWSVITTDTYQSVRRHIEGDDRPDRVNGQGGPPPGGDGGPRGNPRQGGPPPGGSGGPPTTRDSQEVVVARRPNAPARPNRIAPDPGQGRGPDSDDGTVRLIRAVIIFFSAAYLMLCIYFDQGSGTLFPRLLQR